ncbi:MAG TPA: hypothetical protein VEC95_05235 [Terriglobales bacterium]|nr:hypothetical protein [Terriglobales bacterium]
MATGQPPLDDAPFSPKLPPESPGPWRAIIIGVAVVAVVIGLLVWLGSGGRTAPEAPNPYAAQLQISNVKMAAAQNFVGGTVTYVDGKITNTGEKTVTGAVVEVIFRNSLGQVVQKEQIPLRVLVFQGPDRNILDLHSAPLKPGASADFRLTIEGTISADWNQGYPEVRIASVTAN